jgi:hypothetical protein
MCEFKIIKKNDGSQILDEIVILSYSENNELLFKDILGMGEKLDSALIMDVNTLNQTCTIFEHPIIKDFLNLIKSLNNRVIKKSEINELKKKLDHLNV